MEKLTLALVGLILALSLLLRKKTDRGNLSFVLVCLFVFLYRGGSFLFDLFPGYYPGLMNYIGLVGLGSAAIWYVTDQFPPERAKTGRIIILSIFIGSVAILAYLLEPGLQAKLFAVMEIYLTLVMLYILLYILHRLRHQAARPEKKQLAYQAAALSITLTIAALDVFIGPAQRYVTDLSFAALMYFLWLIVAYPQLTRLHELMVRAVGLLVMSFLAALTIVFFTGLFSSPPPFTQVMIASLIVVIAIFPLRLLMERILSRIYPESRDLFSSFYELDRRLEREKTVLLEEMAPVLAHEIRNPLGSIKGAAQYLKGDALPSQHSLLEVIIEETDRLNRVVSQFINYAKPYETKPVRQDIVPIINRAVALIEAHTSVRGVVIEKDFQETLPELAVDAEQIIQVILNIGLNALDAMPAGGTLSFKTLQARKTDGLSVAGLAIRDTGEGISRENMKLIFNPFFTTKKRGVGLGLAICRQIIRKHGGNIEVASVLGRGTTFTIWFKK